MNTTQPRSGVVIAPRDPAVCQPIHEAFSAVGFPSLCLVSRVDRPEEVIARADAEGGVPIILAWSERGATMRFVADLLTCDTLPGRRYVLIAPSEVMASMLSEELEASEPIHAERVLVLGISELGEATARELLAMHLSWSCASYLGRPRRARGVAPAPITEMPMAERVINNIERRNMQRGAFRVQALRTPTF